MTPGKKTTEFWALLFYGAVILVNGTEYVSSSADEMQVFGGVVGAYVLGRSYVKAKTNGKAPTE
ncbi:MAG: hypothetical protein ACR2RE_29220 [Geminicoccaceae bacterium]